MADLDNNQFVTIELFTEDQVQSVVNGTIDLVKDNMRVEMISSIKYLQITTKSNSLVSALSTDSQVFDNNGEGFGVTSADWIDSQTSLVATCAMSNELSSAGFYSNADGLTFDPCVSTYYEFSLEDADAWVEGFFGLLKAMNAILVSTLDCLYNVKCLQLFETYFPDLNQVCCPCFSLSCIFLLSR